VRSQLEHVHRLCCAACPVACLLPYLLWLSTRVAVPVASSKRTPPRPSPLQVPRTLPHALAVFFTHPSSLLIVCALGGLLAWRAHLPPPGPADALVAGCVVAGWCLQVTPRCAAPCMLAFASATLCMLAREVAAI
jgi:hypothetical protein